MDPIYKTRCECGDPVASHAHFYFNYERVCAYCGRQHGTLKKKNLSTFRDIHRGLPAAILGGGPSLPDDMRSLPKNCVLFSVNHHALEIGVDAAYMVYNDDPEINAKLWHWVQAFGGLRFSTHATTNVEFGDVPVWTGFYSSQTAAWLALYMGCDPVILCGMDCYQGPVKHCHPGEPASHSHDQPLEHHLRPWMEDAMNLLPNVERVRVVSGPLLRVFPPYIPPYSSVHTGEKMG